MPKIPKNIVQFKSATDDIITSVLAYIFGINNNVRTYGINYVVYRDANYVLDPSRYDKNCIWKEFTTFYPLTESSHIAELYYIPDKEVTRYKDYNTVTKVAGTSDTYTYGSVLCRTSRGDLHLSMLIKALEDGTLLVKDVEYHAFDDMTYRMDTVFGVSEYNNFHPVSVFCDKLRKVS